jgi:hypothetical protein
MHPRWMQPWTTATQVKLLENFARPHARNNCHQSVLLMATPMPVPVWQPAKDWQSRMMALVKVGPVTQEQLLHNCD